MHRATFVFALLILSGGFGLRCEEQPRPVDHLRVDIPGLENRVRVTTDDLGVPHISGVRWENVWRVQGYVHARDRFFQMDLSRRAAMSPRGLPIR